MIARARDCLYRREGLQGAWLFGSRSSGRARPDSDFDIAVLAAQPLTLEDAMGGTRVDLVDLRSSSPVLHFEALSGERLFVRNPEEVARFSSLAAREYESAMALLKRGYRDRRDRSAGGIGPDSV